MVVFIYANAKSQSCLPQGAIFSTQYQVDNFQNNYPGCTEITGNVLINGSNITNLNGLSVLTFIGGYFHIISADILINLSGLEGLISVGGDLFINENPSLTSLTGLNGLTNVGGEMRILSNNALINLTGLEGLTYLGGDFLIGAWGLGGNSSLTSLTGLGNLTINGGLLKIYQNVSLTSLEGLENINPIPITSLVIGENSSLSTCELQIICDFLAKPNVEVGIYDNAPGCDNTSQVALACGISIPCLSGSTEFDCQADIDNFQATYPGCTEIEGDLWINGYDITNFNGLNVVTSIGGNVMLGFYDAGNNPLLTNLDGLNNLSSIGGHFQIYTNLNLKSLSGLEGLNYIGGGFSLMHNDSLTDFTGLNNLTSIGGNCFIFNNQNLTNCAGLESLTSIGGELHFGVNDNLNSLNGLENLNSISGNLMIYNSIGLNNLTGLEKLNYVGGSFHIGYASIRSVEGLQALTSIGGNMIIENNYMLTSMAGLDNVNPNSISNLTIKNNTALTTCAIQSICDYIVEPNGSIEIYNNASGCNSQEEVETACETLSLEENSINQDFSLAPNPSSGRLTINFNLDAPSPVNFVVHNSLGQIVEILLDETLPPGFHQVNWNAGNLPEGIYFYQMQAGNLSKTGKIVLME